MARVSVVVPNWNTARFLPMCFDSLARQTFRDFEVVLPDSGSTDGSIGLVRSEYPYVRVVALGENRGFAPAVNAGIRSSDSEYVALLNNDTEQDPLWLSELIEAADSHPGAGLFASRMISFHDRRYVDGAGDALRLSGLPYRVGHGELERGLFDEERYVFGACAGAALYRRTMLAEVGLFDEDFESYCEDGDLSFRAQLAGWRCLYVPGAVVYHIGGAATGGKRSEAATRLGTRNSLSLLVKDLPLSVAPHVLPFFLAGQLARLATATATGTLEAHLQGLREFRRTLPLMLGKRRGIQNHRRLSDAEVRRLLAASSLSAARSQVRRVRDALAEALAEAAAGRVGR